MARNGRRGGDTVKHPDPARTRLVYLLPRYDADSPEHLYHLYGFLRKLAGRIPIEILVERVAGRPPQDLPMRPLKIRVPAFRLAEEFFLFLRARSRGVKIFYIHYSYTGVVAASIVVRLFGGRVFYWSCSLYKEFRLPAGAPWRERLRQRIQERMLEISVRACTHLVTGTPRVAEYYAREVGISPQKIRLLPNFTDVERFQGASRSEARKRLGLPAGRKTALFLHRVAPRKGAHFLPEIARKVIRGCGPVTFLVAGGGPYLEELMRRVEQEGLAGHFDFRGWVPNREVPLYFRSADLYLMPSVEEGFPRVLLEAMAAGCPFVAFDIGGVRDLLPQSLADCVVEPNDLSLFSRKCVRALQNPALRNGWRKAGGRQARLFSEDRVLEAFLRMIDGQALDWHAFLSSAEIDL
jgi:glycosyltransferase involved in cell wall biosynthesis